MGSIHSDGIGSGCDHCCVSATREVTNSEVKEFVDIASGWVIAGDLGRIDSVVSDILEYDGRAEGQRAQLLRAELVGADGVEEGQS